MVFAPQGRRSIAGDGSSHRLSVGTQTLAASLELSTVPKIVPEVYRRARIAYSGALPLIPGKVSTYVDSDFVGSGTIKAVVPGENLELSFGTDDRLKVDRRLAHRSQESVGLGRRTVRYTFEFHTTVTNYTDSTQELEIVDQIPVSETERVTVKVIEITGDQSNREDDPAGVLRWTRSMAPGASTTLIVRFSVTAPREAEFQSYMDEMDTMY